MRIKAVLALFLSLAIIIISLSGGTGCANIIPPSGGPRDSLPPQLIKATPPDSSRNISSNRITFTFDEYIELQNVQANLIVSPIPEKFPTVDYRLNTVTVRLRDTLESNTTYSFNFGNSIKDYNEGNILPGFTYVFSTGPTIDSLEFKGNVLLAETGKVDSTLIVMLHKSGDDSAVAKERPRYITKLDRDGDFIFKNMPAGIFYLYALQDQSGSQKYLDTKNLFAFADTPVVISRETAPVTLYAYAETTSTTPAIPQLRPRTGGAGENRLRYQTSLSGDKHDILEKFQFSFEQPLKTFDSSKIKFTTDSTFTEVTGYSWEIDSTLKKIQLNYQWNENTLYHFILEKDFAVDTSDRVLLKNDTLSFRTKARSEYASLRIRFRNLDLTGNPVLQLIVGNEIKKSIPINAEEIYEPLFLPGDYELRLLYDRNKNGKWDPGQFFGKHIQPEIAKPVERRLAVKPGQENEFEIAL